MKPPSVLAPLVKILLAAFIMTLIAGCGNRQESARKELVKLGKNFNTDGFIESVGDGDKQAVTLFLEAGFDANTPAENGITALHIAAMKGNADIVKMLLDKGANPNAAVISGSEKGSTPLMVAVAGGYLETTKLLVDKGADVNAKDANDLVVMDYATGQTNLNLLKILWQHGAPFLTEKAFAKLMDQFQFDLRAKAARSMNAGESPDACREFIKEQLSNFQQEQNFTTNQLLQARVVAFRAVTSVVDKSVALDASSALGVSEKERQAVKDFTAFLKELQSDPAVQAQALITAILESEPGVVKWLLEQRADVNHKDETGVTPLMNAAVANKTIVVQVLLDGGADVNLKDHQGWTATMYAAARGNVEPLKLILEKKPELDAANGKGQTALMLAEQNNNADEAVLLKNAGAKEN